MTDETNRRGRAERFVHHHIPCAMSMDTRDKIVADLVAYEEAALTPYGAWLRMLFTAIGERPPAPGFEFSGVTYDTLVRRCGKAGHGQ